VTCSPPAPQAAPISGPARARPRAGPRRPPRRFLDRPAPPATVPRKSPPLSARDGPRLLLRPRRPAPRLVSARETPPPSVRGARPCRHPPENPRECFDGTPVFGYIVLL